MNKKEFIAQSRIIHKNKYDYSKVDYVNKSTKVCIICKEHGEFWQKPNKHLMGQGCPKCAHKHSQQKRAMTYQVFEERSNKIHDNTYQYHQDYKNYSTKVRITCQIHGDFYQTPNHHLCGQGCPKCAIEKNSQKQQLTIEEFIEKSKQVHGNKYDYGKCEYVNYKTPVKIICHKIGVNKVEHGEFWQTPDAHLHNHGCPKCGNQISNNENEIISFIEKKCHLECITHSRQIIPPYELDMYIPSKNIAIEYDGLIWHSEKFGKDRYYHLDKTKKCEKNGIRLIHIFEDEWKLRKKIIKEKLEYILGCDNDKQKIYARKCEISEIKNNEAKVFLDRYHIQGFGCGSVYLGCFFKKELVSVMCFKKDGDKKWELTRFASVSDKICIGTAGKLLKYFIRNYEVSEIKSFADRRWSCLDNMYEKIGFRLDSVTKPDYSYVDDNGNRFHKFLCRKNRLINNYPHKNLTIDMTENEMANIVGLYKIWNCGLYKYVYENKETNE